MADEPSTPDSGALPLTAQTSATERGLVFIDPPVTVTNVMGMYTVSLKAHVTLNAGEILMKAPTVTVYANNNVIATKGMAMIAGSWAATLDQVFPQPDAVRVDIVIMDATHTITPEEAFVIL